MRFHNDGLCFECEIRPGLDCPGRQVGERTRCQQCLETFMTQIEKEQVEYERRLCEGNQNEA